MFERSYACGEGCDVIPFSDARQGTSEWTSFLV
jgi:hypothetical protein